MDEDGHPSRNSDLHTHDTSVSMFVCLAEDLQFMPGSKAAQEITFNLRGDYIVAVEQAGDGRGS